MVFSSELGGESTASKYVCVCEWGLSLGAYDGWVVFSLHLWMCTPRATSREFLLARKGAVEYAWIMWSDPVVLASCRIFP